MAKTEDRGAQEVFRELTAGSYRVIAADPPWTYSAFSPKGEERGAQAHYDCMTLDDICALPVAELTAPDCHLFLWATGPCLFQAERVMKAWGFTYSALALVWVKTNPRHGSALFWTRESFFVGMGHTTRQNVELVLLGRKGSPKRKRKDVRQLIIAPRREHSRKPEQVRERIEAYADGPYAELFSRSTRAGWDVWGNEAGKFSEGA